MYWSHVEFYPSHAGIPMNGVVDGLLNTLVHAQGGPWIRNDSLIVHFFETDFRRPNLDSFDFPLLR
jgi:hypothetical protein